MTITLGTLEGVYAEAKKLWERCCANRSQKPRDPSCLRCDMLPLCTIVEGQEREGNKLKIWSCKIGEIENRKLPDGADLPMRQAIRVAYMALTGQEPQFLFSGWAAELTEGERAVVERKEKTGT